MGTLTGRAFAVPPRPWASPQNAALLATLEALGGAVPLRGRLNRATGPSPTTAPLPRIQPLARRFKSRALGGGGSWLRYKTTDRGLYDRTRAALPQGLDEVLFLNERDELCEGTTTNVFLRCDDGPCVRPR